MHCKSHIILKEQCVGQFRETTTLYGRNTYGGSQRVWFLSGVGLEKAIGCDHIGLKWGTFFTLVVVLGIVFTRN